MKNFRLHKISHYPSQRRLENGYMLDIQGAWAIHTADHGRIGVVLRTPYGDRCVSDLYLPGWAGCWHIGDKRACAGMYVADYYWQMVADKVSCRSFDDRWIARCAYLDGATVEQAIALAKLGAHFLREFVTGYKTAASWSSLHDPEGDGSEFIDGTGATWSKAADAEARRICRQFCQENTTDLLEALSRGRPADHLGHDLWLTSAGHGAGFWDRQELDAGDLGQRLTEACESKPYKDREIYVSRKKIYYA